MNDLLAAIDLGSNSFRLSVGQVMLDSNTPRIHTLERRHETVHLAQGLGPGNVLDEASIGRALGVLQEYGKRLTRFTPAQVRAVATNTFRVASNAADLLARASDALGFPIEVIGGHEEARLIYAGIAHELSPTGQKRLIIDIGGGSTEVIIGHNSQPLLLCSLPIGCGTLTRRFFPDGRISPVRLELARLAARQHFARIGRVYRKTGWTETYGSSGTAKGLLAILHENAWSDGITAWGLEQLQQRLITDGEVIASRLPGIKPARAPVLAGGLAIMLAAFDELQIKHMSAGEGALRMGVLYDLARCRQNEAAAGQKA